MANSEHLRILEKGVRKWNAWRGSLHDLLPEPEAIEPEPGTAQLIEAELSETEILKLSRPWERQLKKAYSIK